MPDAYVPVLIGVKFLADLGYAVQGLLAGMLRYLKLYWKLVKLILHTEILSRCWQELICVLG